MNGLTGKQYSVLVALLLAAGMVGNCDVAEEYRIEAQEKVMRPARVMLAPPAEAVEPEPRVVILTPPLRCEGRGGREWIRSWGDGDLPPPIPTCAKARRE